MAVPTPEKLLPVPTAKCTVGCPLLDRCLGGGVPCNSVTEIFAESSSGKTQFCLQLCLSAQLPTSHGGLSASSLFLHSEPPFPLRRLRQLSHHFSLRHSSSSAADPSDNIFIRAVHSADQLLDEMPSIASFFSSRSKSTLPVRLLVVDSIAALFRSDFDNTPADLRRRSSLFFRISGELKSLAKRFDLAVVVTNQVVDFFEGSQPRIGDLRWLCSSGRRVCPALGVSWANCVNSRLFLSREDPDGDDHRGGDRTVETKRRFHVIFAPHLPQSSTEFVIRREGVFGVQ